MARSCGRLLGRLRRPLVAVAVGSLTSGILLAGGGLSALANASGSSASSVAAHGDVLTYTFATRTLSLHHDGRTTTVARLSYDLGSSPAYSATGGLVFFSGQAVYQVTPTGTLHRLSHGFAIGVAVGDSGRQIVWTESAPVNGRSYSTLHSIDERQPLVDRTSRVPYLAMPVGVLTDGLVAVREVFNGAAPVLWRPSTGQLRALHGVQGLSAAFGHTVVVADKYGCSLALRNATSGTDTSLHPRLCARLVGRSPNGTRWLGTATVGTIGAFATLPVIAGADGAYDPRLSRVLSTTGWSVTDARWSGNRHVQLIAVGVRKGQERAVELRCSVPVHAAPTCAEVHDFGVVEGGIADRLNPPSVYLVH